MHRSTFLVASEAGPQPQEGAVGTRNSCAPCVRRCFAVTGLSAPQVPFRARVVDCWQTRHPAVCDSGSQMKQRGLAPRQYACAPRAEGEKSALSCQLAV